MSALQDFNRHYFELHPLDKAASKEVDVKTKLKETLDLLESLRGKSLLPVALLSLQSLK